MRFTSKEQEQEALMALLDCYELWAIIAETGATKWEVLGRLGKIYREACPACDFTVRWGYEFCRDNCIIPWPGGACTHAESPYFGVWGLDKEGIKTRATEIVKLIEKAIQYFEGLSTEEICKLIERRNNDLPKMYHDCGGMPRM